MGPIEAFPQICWAFRRLYATAVKGDMLKVTIGRLTSRLMRSSHQEGVRCHSQQYDVAVEQSSTA
jgi:hypothetical protein